MEWQSNFAFIFEQTMLSFCQGNNIGFYDLGASVFWFIMCTNGRKHCFHAFFQYFGFWEFFKVEKKSCRYGPQIVTWCRVMALYKVDRDDNLDRYCSRQTTCFKCGFFFFFLSIIVKSIKKEQRRYNRNKQDFPPKEESGIKALCQTQKIQKRNYKEMDEKGKLCRPLALLTY